MHDYTHNRVMTSVANEMQMADRKRSLADRLKNSLFAKLNESIK